MESAPFPLKHTHKITSTTFPWRITSDPTAAAGLAAAASSQHRSRSCPRPRPARTPVGWTGLASAGRCTVGSGDDPHVGPCSCRSHHEHRRRHPVRTSAQAGSRLDSRQHTRRTPQLGQRSQSRGGHTPFVAAAGGGGGDRWAAHLVVDRRPRRARSAPAAGPCGSARLDTGWARSGRPGRSRAMVRTGGGGGDGGGSGAVSWGRWARAAVPPRLVQVAAWRPRRRWASTPRWALGPR